MIGGDCMRADNHRNHDHHITAAQSASLFRADCKNGENKGEIRSFKCVHDFVTTHQRYPMSGRDSPKDNDFSLKDIGNDAVGVVVLLHELGCMSFI